jgi:hypothetical protein
LATALVASLRASYGAAGTLTWRASPAEANALIEHDREFRLGVEEVMRELMSEAKGIVAQYRDGILEVATALIEEGSLNAARISSILAVPANGSRQHPQQVTLSG